jgi:hypothetical protein
VLADAPRPAVPRVDVDPGWATTAALGQVISAAADCLTGLNDRASLLADALDSAARGYEWCDAGAAGRIHAALRERCV